MPPQNSFHNPYHFVPVSAKPGPDAVSIKAFQSDSDRPAHLTHARYAAQTKLGGATQPVFSGRIICRLETKSPLVLGGEQSKPGGDKDVTVVEPFILNSLPAIPASSLRGLISSMAEAASNSALRVFDNAHGYSFRRAASEGLSALGMIIIRPGSNGTEY